MFPANWLTDCLTQPANSSGAGGSASRSIKNVKPPPPCTPRLAGLKWGRDKGLVWHTLRHEFCSRTAENTGDPVVAQELGRGAFEQEVTVGSFGLVAPPSEESRPRTSPRNELRDDDDEPAAGSRAPSNAGWGSEWRECSEKSTTPP